jgi:hypothetical protein
VSPRLSLLVKHRGDRQALNASGFRIESCLGTICAGTLPLRGLSAFAARPEVEFVQSSSWLRATVPVGPWSPAPLDPPRAQAADGPRGDGRERAVAFSDLASMSHQTSGR